MKYSLVAAILNSLPPNQRSCATASTTIPRSLRHLASPVMNVPVLAATFQIPPVILPAVSASVIIVPNVSIADCTSAHALELVLLVIAEFCFLTAFAVADTNVWA